MTISKNFIKYDGYTVPEIKGAGGGKGGGKISPNSLFSTDFLFLTTAIGEGPVYRINPNGPQDIQIQDSSIEDLIIMDDINPAIAGTVNNSTFYTGIAYGTTTQDAIPNFSDSIVSPQSFAAPVALRYGNVRNIPKSSIQAQETSTAAWDRLTFLLVVDQLSKSDDKGTVIAYQVQVTISVWPAGGVTRTDENRTQVVVTIKGKTDKPVKRDIDVIIGEQTKSTDGYVFTIEKTSLDSADAKIADSVSVLGWYEIEDTKQAYPRTAMIGYALKATNEHTGGIPTFTSMTKGLLVKVPTNYNQPVLSGTDYPGRDGEIDWRQLELPESGPNSYVDNKYYLQNFGTALGNIQGTANPQIYIGAWDGSFVYSWTQNPIWILYDILTNQTYGLSIPERNIDKFKFYQVAQYCDACDPISGRFIGVDGLADGSYRYKPRGKYTTVRQNQLGLPNGTPIKERRFISDISITEQERGMDLLNKISATFRGMLVYANGKITLAVDMPNEYPAMIFNEATIKAGSFSISGTKESDIYTGVDVSYIDPTNHFKRETVRIDSADANDGTEVSDIENIASIDLFGVTRRSQAVRMAQYHLAASKFQRRNVSFTTSVDAINLAPGDVISISSQGTGIAYGYGGKIALSSDRNLITSSEDFTNAAWTAYFIKPTLTTGVLAPNGTNTATSWNASTTLGGPTTNSGGLIFGVGQATTGVIYTASVWLKASSPIAVNFGIDDGSFSTINITTEWVRYSYTGTTSSTNRRLFQIYEVTNADIAISIWGAQVEIGSAPSAYLKTPGYIELENYTDPGITPSLFIDSTKPITLRVINQASDRIELYNISNTDYAISSSAGVANSAILVKAVTRFDKNTQTFVSLPASGFTANLAPKAGDLWSIGTAGSLSDYYSSKAGKLFKVTGTKREGSSEEISVSGVEYISNVYVDSDTFINYQPTSYTDIFSPFSTPPTPNFTFSAVPRRKLDGTIVVDGVISTSTDASGYGQKFETQYYIAAPSATSLVANVISTSPLTLTAINPSVLSNGTSATISNKNGFSTAVGKIKLLCTSWTVLNNRITFTIEGLSSCIDLNYNMHVLDVLGSSNTSLYGENIVTLPVIAKTPSAASKNFVGYASELTEITRTLTSYDIANNTITIFNTLAESGGRLRNALQAAPFYLYISQVLDSTNYSTNSFYVEGSNYAYVDSGDLITSSINTITLPIKPRDSKFVSFYADGILLESSSYTLNTNKDLSLSANITYTAATNESSYRVEVEHYSVPAIELEDRLEVSYANVFFVLGSSYDPTSPKYNAALTSNCIYRIELSTTPTFNLGGSRFINTSLNPVGTINNVTGSSFTLDYDATKYPGNFKLTNNRIYSLEVASNYVRQFLTPDSTIPELDVGTTSVRAINVNTIGRTSPSVEQSVFVSTIPIQKVSNLAITESIYIEQLAAAAIRITISFDHILNQDVTDYEISYKMDFKTSTDENTSEALTSFNTVKVPASGVDTNGKISFTINNVNRGAKDALNSILVKVTPLNKSIRGIVATLTQTIKGKSEPPQNVLDFIVGQQNDTITFSWSYAYKDGVLVDLDLESIEIRKVPGSVAINIENFNIGQPVVIVSAGSVRKSVPIDGYGTYTYLAMTKDTSGNASKEATGSIITLVAAQRDRTVFAYSEDDSTDNYSGIVNTNAGEYNFPSYNNVVTQGIVGISSTRADNANASASGWSAIPGFPTNIKATANAIYTTQIRDVGQPVTGTVRYAIAASQEIQSTYADQHTVIFNGTSIISSNANTLISTGIGTLLAGSTYSTTNKTLVSGANVWAIWNPGINSLDAANANSYALVAAVINANAIALGASYFTNGNPTGGNALANVTTKVANFQVVDLKQYSDYTTTTYAGDPSAVSTKLFIRTTLNNPYFANGNVNSAAFSSTSNGFVPYEAGSRTFRYLQLKYVITNTKPDEYDFTLDKFRYNIDKERTTFTNTVVYSSAPTTVDFSSAKFLSRPVISYTVVNQVDALANPAVVVTTASSNSSVSFQLVAAKTGTAYPANGSANVSITATGV
jgi:hypothetical protein